MLIKLKTQMLHRRKQKQSSVANKLWQAKVARIKCAEHSGMSASHTGVLGSSSGYAPSLSFLLTQTLGGSRGWADPPKGGLH